MGKLTKLEYFLMISLTRAGFENSLQSSFRWMVIRDLCESGGEK